MIPKCVIEWMQENQFRTVTISCVYPNEIRLIFEEGDKRVVQYQLRCDPLRIDELYAFEDDCRNIVSELRKPLNSESYARNTDSTCINTDANSSTCDPSAIEPSTRIIR